jgi:CRP/FNR family transcriptional regulator, anaerobic regulatory protein
VFAHAAQHGCTARNTSGEPHVNLAAHTSPAFNRPLVSTRPAALTAAASAASSAVQQAVPAWREHLALLQAYVPFTRRMFHAGESVYQSGEPMVCLHIVNAGQFKTVNYTADGRGQVVGLHFKGAWLGFDGIAQGRHTCDATALDTAEVWAVRYDDLLRACAEQPQLLRAMHAAMSQQIGRECDTLLSLGTLPADARVANFIHDWAQALAVRELRTDSFRLPMSRAEIGNYLGLTLETVSRALHRLADRGVIRFDQKGRRDISVPCLQALRDVIAWGLDGQQPKQSRPRHQEGLAARQ